MTSSDRSSIYFDLHLQVLVGPDGRTIALRPQSSDVLRLLVANAGRVVSKQEIIDAVWAGQAVSDDSVYQCISEIRRTIDDGPGGLAIITKSRRGYFVEGLSDTASPISSRPFTVRDAEPIRYVHSNDGTRIAWTASGRGVPVLKTPGWINHLGAERRNSLYGPFYDRLGGTARIARYDQRGSGMSSWHIPPLSLESMAEDILTVAGAAGLDRFFLLGVSQGVAFAIAFARRHPERVLGIIGRGGYALGDLAGGNERNRQTYEGAVKMMELGWESDDPTFRRHFTSRLVPDALPDMANQVDDLQRISIPKENLRDFLNFDAHIDVRDDARHVGCPVLLLHSRDDRMVPLADGEQLASLLPDCSFVTVEGPNHVVVPGTPGFETTIEECAAFLLRNAPAEG